MSTLTLKGKHEIWAPEFHQIARLDASGKGMETFISSHFITAAPFPVAACAVPNRASPDQAA